MISHLRLIRISNLSAKLKLQVNIILIVHKIIVCVDVSCMYYLPL